MINSDLGSPSSLSTNRRKSSRELTLFSTLRLPKLKLEYCIIIECGSLQNPKKYLYYGGHKRICESIDVLLSFLMTTFCELLPCLARCTEPKLPDPNFFCFTMSPNQNAAALNSSFVSVQVLEV